MDIKDINRDHLVSESHELKKDRWRLVCITGTDISEENEQIEVLYHFVRDSEMKHLRIVTDGQETFPSLVPIFANALFLENELKEMLGVNVDGIDGHLLLHPEDCIETPLKRLRGLSYQEVVK